MLESQIARADDFSEDASSRMAAQMLKTQLAFAVTNPAMLGMVQAMFPDVGKIWANENTRAYLKDLLAGQPAGGSTSMTGSSSAAAASGSSAGAGSSSAGCAGSSSADAAPGASSAGSGAA